MLILLVSKYEPMPFLPNSMLLFILFMSTAACHTEGTSDTNESSTSITETENIIVKDPLRVAVIGLVHTHVHWLLGREDRGDIEIVGIVEPNRELAKRYSEQHGYSMNIVFDSMNKMMEQVQPEAVTGFNTTFDHLDMVKFFAPRKIHMMVEKPLAVNLAHANEMAALAKQYDVHLLTNYETSWYGSNQHAYQILHDNQQIGDLTRILFYTGHPGPIEIGCNEEFLDWLTDPVRNGGGALPDFACYGANLTTWILQGANPLSVTCISRQTKPDKYPEVEDDATIILNYPDDIQVIIQASWNWSHNRKEMEMYGTQGYVFCRDGSQVQQLLAGHEESEQLTAAPLAVAINDPFAYLRAVIRKEVSVQDWDVSALPNNLRVMQILDAAKWSAEEGRTISWEEFVARSDH